jgi:uncharacterized protein YecA (UPF0149 family)
MKKSGTADKICAELLEKNPSDCDTLLLRAKIAASMRHVDKADGYFDSAVSAAPLNPKAWSGYMRYSIEDAPWQVSKVFFRAMEQDINMFRDEYVLYLEGARNLDLFKNQLQYYDKFAEFYINDKDPDKDIYSYIMYLMQRLIQNEELIPFVEKIVPVLENSKHYMDEDKEDFRQIRIAIVMHKLHSDKRMHEVLVDLTEFLLVEEKDKNEQLSMEVYIVFNLPLLRPSIRILRSEYPECFKLNQAFYLDALNEKKTDFLMDKYAALFRKSRPSVTEYKDGEESEDVTFRRESPKVGRNEPCPCGSGKKFKKCCGRN